MKPKPLDEPFTPPPFPAWAIIARKGNRVALLVVAAFFGLTANSGRAALVFDRPSQTVPAKWSDKQVVAVYNFKNEGPEKVTITGMETSCGCTALTLDKKEYAPGEIGVIRLVFTVADKLGFQSKTATLTTDLPSQPAIILAFVTTIPDPIATDPAVLIWEPNVSDPKPMSIAITLAPGFPLKELKLGGGVAFHTVLTPLVPGQR